MLYDIDHSSSTPSRVVVVVAIGGVSVCGVVLVLALEVLISNTELIHTQTKKKQKSFVKTFQLLACAHPNW